MLLERESRWYNPSSTTTGLSDLRSCIRREAVQNSGSRQDSCQHVEKSESSSRQTGVVTWIYVSGYLLKRVLFFVCVLLGAASGFSQSSASEVNSNFLYTLDTIQHTKSGSEISLGLILSLSRSDFNILEEISSAMRFTIVAKGYRKMRRALSGRISRMTTCQSS